MEFYKEIKQKHKRLNTGTYSLSNIQPIDNLDDWNNFVAKFKELINQKVESDPKESSFFISDSKLKECWPKDKDGKILDANVISQLLDMILGIRIEKDSYDKDDGFYVDVLHSSNYQYKKVCLFSLLLMVCLNIGFVISLSTSLFTFILAVIINVAFCIWDFCSVKEDILKFRYLRRLKKAVLKNKTIKLKTF